MGRKKGGGLRHDREAERQHRDPDIAREERQTLARHRLAVRLRIRPKARGSPSLELHERIEKLEDRQGSLNGTQAQRPSAQERPYSARGGVGTPREVERSGTAGPAGRNEEHCPRPYGA